MEFLERTTLKYRNWADALLELDSILSLNF